MLCLACAASLSAQSTFDTIINNNFYLNSGPPCTLLEKTQPSMWIQLRQFRDDCVAASLTPPQSTTYYSGQGIALIKWEDTTGYLVSGADPDSSILIVTAAAGTGGNPGDDGYGEADTADSGVYVMGGDGIVGGMPGTGGGLADADGPTGMVSNTPASGNSGEIEIWN